ncbi:hypothetical protein ARMSODRAFT_973369 [Armillaria solidipes]|uniref:Uncharacterized protein n=1 Tax=Armillaria solidipes TaxID=1076256 RepID=A0A2H3C0F3_9AGAR|nr:hypothetical protein ARMSODRAFT_973369 [Armillaria solidipes]
MESTKPATFYAPDVAPLLVVLLAATDIIVLQMLTAWALEPLPHNLKLLAKTLQRTKARFRPYPTEVTRSCLGSPACSHSATPAPSSSPSPPPPCIDKGKKKQTSMPPPPTPGPMDSGEEDGKDGDEDEDGKNGEELQNKHVLKQPSRATVERLLIPQPKGIGSLGLKQLDDHSQEDSEHCTGTYYWFFYSSQRRKWCHQLDMKWNVVRDGEDLKSGNEELIVWWLMLQWIGYMGLINDPILTSLSHAFKKPYPVEGTVGGACVYALRQAVLREHMYNHCTVSWSYVDEWIELSQVPPDEEEEEQAGL